MSLNQPYPNLQPQSIALTGGSPRFARAATSKFRVLAITCTALFLIAVTTACASDPEPRIEDFPSLLLGTWEQIGGPDGTLTFSGSTASGIGRRSADGIAAETFTYQWVAPAIIRTNIGNDTEFNVLFEDSGETLVLATVAIALEDGIIRYKRRS